MIESLKERLKAPEQAALANTFARWIHQVLPPSRLRGAKPPPVRDLPDTLLIWAERVLTAQSIEEILKL
ncbi:MAG TPA: hypothetical protein VFJ58_28330 [Armatimonadota bacterium]|nr:hypothetical protein [Armatimonadota bacterium]